MNTQNHSNLHKPETGEESPASGAKSFEEFVYLLSHDVRNSVRALVEVPQWIKEDLTAEGHSIHGSLAENFDLMETHTRRLDRMFVDLLVYSRVGKRQTVKPIDLSEAIEQTLAQLKPPSEFQVTCDLKYQVLRFGDQDILTLLSALISNAIKHHHRDGGNIHISSRKEGSECAICIHDDGPGIPEKSRARVFDVMTTLKSRDEVEGSGMGLAITRKIVEHYGGSLGWQAHEHGKGLALEMRIPI